MFTQMCFDIQTRSQEIERWLASENLTISFSSFSATRVERKRIVLRKCNLLLNAFLGTKWSTSTQNQGLITKNTKNSQPYLNPINLVQRRKQNFAIWVD